MELRTAQFADQIGKSLPLEVGFNRSLTGTSATRLTSPIPPIVSQPSFEDVVTRSMLDPYQFTPQQTTFIQPTIESKLPEVKQPDPEPEIEPQEPEIKCTGPQGLCPEDAGNVINAIFLSESKMECNDDCWNHYGGTIFEDSEVQLLSDVDFLIRTDDNIGYLATDTMRMSITTAFAEGSSESTKVHVLLIHDFLEDRRTWRCLQGLIGAFADNTAVDLIGSGSSTMPRGLNKTSYGMNVADPFPWSFAFHASTLLKFLKVYHSGKTVYVVGSGWGAQIAATMASMDLDSVIKGVIMVNPPGFSKDVFPEPLYVALAESNRHESFMTIACLNSNRKNAKRVEKNSALKSIAKEFEEEGSVRRSIMKEQLKMMTKLQYQQLVETSGNPSGIDVSKITIPVHVVYGNSTTIYRAESRHYYHGVYYNAKVSTSIIENCGHFCHIENPRCLGDLILDFMKSNGELTNLNCFHLGFSGDHAGDEDEKITQFNAAYGI